MSAIAGLWHLDGRPGAADLLTPMQRALAPFGADRADAWDGGAVALGSRLTVLLPEDVHDRQPLVGGGGRFVLVADLRLDNRPELAEALGIDQRRAGAMADSDLLLAAWERWGEGCPARLIGAFAFALWDAENRRLHLVRDQMGERPLFYHHSPDRIVFASMYHGLHALPDIPLAPDLGAVRAHAAFFADYKDRSFHAGIKRVPPGSRLEINAGGLRVNRYWELPDPAPLRLSSDAEYVEAYRETFDRAVRDRLRAIGPIGCHLSAGYDSSAVATTAAAMLAERGQRLSAYTAVPMDGVTLHPWRGQIIDESGIASITAGRYANMDHILVGRDGRAIGEDFEMIFTYLQQPIRNACNRVWRFDIARRMQERKERVLLNAIFGNLTISYNDREALPEMLATGRWLRLARELRLLARGGYSVPGLLAATLTPFTPEPVVALARHLTGRKRVTRRYASPLSEAALAAIQTEEAEGRWEDMARVAVGSARTRRGRIGFGLFQGDTGAFNTAMLGAFGTDERDASRDVRFINLILSLPSRMFLRDGQAKWIYRQAFAGRVPPEVMMPASRKGYQSADWMHRLAKGRTRINAILDQARGVAAIEEMFDMPDLVRLSREELVFDQAHLPEVRDRLRFRFLTGICNIDFLLRAGLGRTG
ncbi:asparagine synthase-related protein [Azospirillum soli]|uniref:asparagine synthase-related protein n=1 Tax=Azospirillum soli TaxID=1304799 RepID=UPI001AE48426|nr:asparagine synthase-related protein [Azospirillum soli]MBP2312717.1 asparagine synthase (glutamine-hydrolyzing) [Azospirillum soli]